MRKIRKEEELENMRVHTIPFFCKIGQIEAKLKIGIETDPLKNGKGTAAHYHAFPSCQKINSGSYPYRCVVTNKVCLFWEPFGGYEVEPYKRNFVYISNFIRSVSFIEFWGKKAIIMRFKSKGVNIEKHFHISLMQVIILLRVFDLIDKDTYDGLIEIKKFRDELLHKPKMLMDYKEYNEKVLSKMTTKADDLKFKIIDISNEQKKVRAFLRGG